MGRTIHRYMHVALFDSFSWSLNSPRFGIAAWSLGLVTESRVGRMKRVYGGGIAKTVASPSLYVGSSACLSRGVPAVYICISIDRKLLTSQHLASVPFLTLPRFRCVLRS